jgi:hypothetical protein
MDRPDRRKDRPTRRRVVARRARIRLGGAVQHGASTSPDAFDAFSSGACEIHLATDFQNMIYDHARFQPN